MNENERLKREVEDLKWRLDKLEKSDRQTAYKTIQMLEGRNIQLGTANGTKIGTASTQKLGIWGATPTTQQTHPGNLSYVSSPPTKTQVDDIVDKVNGIISDLVNLGFYNSP